MKIEKILLSFVAIVIGLIVAGVGFYIYQSTKTIPPSKLGTIKIAPPTPTPQSVYLTVDSPTDQSTTNNKTVTISGKTVPSATVVISTPTADQVVSASSQGDFTTTATIQDGENEIYISAIGPAGTESEKMLTVTYTTENF